MSSGLIRRWPGITILLLLGLLLTVNISLGSVYIPFSKVMAILTHQGVEDAVFRDILWQFRLPKAITCIVAGSALATSGLLMQTLFRNPLAGPDVLGLSSGASLAVAFVLLLGSSSKAIISVTNPWALAVTASLVSGLVFFLVLLVAQRIKDNASLLIIGLMIGAASGSLVSVLQFLSRAQDLQAFMIWTLGNVGGTNWGEIAVLAFLLLLGVGVSLASQKSINAWLLGENYAQSLGVSLKRSRTSIVFATSILAGGVTAFCGPIAFVGLAVPHLVRLLVPTTNHKILIPMVMAGGAALLLLCDILAQLPGSATVLPLNAVTSIIGAPVVIWVVMRSKGLRM